MSLRIAHLSDPHFGTVKPEVLAGLKESLHRLKPSCILISGDITQRARPDQFLAARNFVKSLAPTPVIAIPGNHDIPLFNLPARLLRPYAGFRRLFKGSLNKDYVQNRVQIIGLNSTSRWRHVQGDFAPGKLEKYLKRFVRKDVAVRILAFHHPMDCAKWVDEKNLLRGRDSAMKLFEESQIDLIVGGHIHDPYVNLSTERYPDIKRATVLAVAGTCLSWRIRAGAPNSFNLIEVDTEMAEPKLSITRYDAQMHQPVTSRQATSQQAKSPHSESSAEKPIAQFSPVGTTEFQRKSNGWESLTQPENERN